MDDLRVDCYVEPGALLEISDTGALDVLVEVAQPDGTRAIMFLNTEGVGRVFAWLTEWLARNG